jgi:PKD repeat protein
MKNNINKTILFFLFFISADAYSQTDNPCGSPALTVGTSCNFNTTGSLPTSATNTAGIPAPGCASYVGPDVWYQVTVPASGSLTIDLNTAPGGPTDIGMAWYTGTCTGMTLLECDDDDSNNGLMPMIARTGLTPGSTIWVRIWEYGGGGFGNFRICAFAGSSSGCTSGGGNVNCASADPFCTGTSYNFCNSTGIPSMGGGGIYGCLGSTPNPAFYYFQVGSSGNIQIGIQQVNSNGFGIDVDFVLWGPFTSQAAMCPGISASNIVSCSYSTAFNETATINSAVAGNWYMLLITNYSNQTGSVSFSQTGGNGSTNCNVLSPCSITTTQTNATCSGGNNGTATATVTGTPTYTYVWSPAPGGGQGTNTATGLTAQPYTLTVTQASGGACSTTVTILQPAVLNGTTSVVNPTCLGSCNGSITVNPTGGTGAVQYGLNGGPLQASNIFSGLCAGNYSITIRDANNCQATINAVVNNGPSVTASATPTVPSCIGSCDGSISVTASGGTGALQYSLDGTTFQSSNNFNSLCAGSYTITVRDINNCGTTTTTVINDGTLITASIDPVSDQCFAGNSFSFNGSNSSISNGSVSSYSWNWGDGSPDGNGVNANHSYASSGTFTVTLTVSNGICTDTETLPVTVNQNPSMLAVVSDAACNGATGSVSVTPIGGGPFTINHYDNTGVLQSSVSGATAAELFSGIVPGTYSFEVVDALGCDHDTSVTVSQPALMVLTASNDTLICIGGTASLITNTTGGTAPYSYTWNNGGTNSVQNVNPVVTTNFDVFATDANGCTSNTEIVIVSVNPPMSVTVSANDTICPGEQATFSATASGGNGGPYIYSWTSNGNPAGSTSGITPTPSANGTIYTVTATDNCGTPVATASTSALFFAVPQPTFSTDITGDCYPVTVNFMNTTNPGMVASAEWNFGDGNTSTSTTIASNTYPNAACYDITLTVTSPQGCTNSATMPDYI